MNKKAIGQEIGRAMNYASDQLTEYLQDTANKIARDQAVWLDKMMADILPPKLYEAGRHGDMMDEIETYLTSHKFKIIFIPDSFSVRIMRGDCVHAQFITQLTVDGEPIDKTPTHQIPGNN